MKKNKKGRSDDDVRLVEKMVMHKNLFLKSSVVVGYCHPNYSAVLLNRPFSSSRQWLFQSESQCKNFIVVIRF